MNDLDKTSELDLIAREISNCEKCDLCKTRTKTVPGSGNHSASILFVGEAPGDKEDKSGLPFCGAAGKFLDKMLESINLRREDVFIANTVKCRPPENRDPEISEKNACRPYLERQIVLIKPKIIVCLGRHAVASMLPDQPNISKIHGDPIAGANGIIYLPLYHPAAALHNGSLRATLLADFAKIQDLIKNFNKK